jgi:hypothetical protein
MDDPYAVAVRLRHHQLTPAARQLLGHLALSGPGCRVTFDGSRHWLVGSWLSRRGGLGGLLVQGPAVGELERAGLVEPCGPPLQPAAEWRLRGV